MAVSEKDIQILRELAQKYMSYASLPIQEEKRRLWRALNDLHMEKPMVCIDQLPWNELDVDGSLVCRVEHSYYSNVERELRMQIYKWEHLPADMVLEPYIQLPRLIEDSGYGVERQVESLNYDNNSSVNSQHFTNLFEEPEDLEKIQTPRLTVDLQAEAVLLAEAQTIFNGIAPVKFRGITLHMGLWDTITQWMGVENIYIELMDRPEFMHAMMEKMTNATLASIAQINRLGLYNITDPICHCSYTYDSKLPPSTCDPTHPTTHDGWGFGLAQLFTSVSPAITAEFEVPYMQRLFPHFGAIYYGCCDRLDDRLDIIARMPNIRKVSCSPWSDRERFAEKLPKHYIMSNKPTPALLAGSSFDEEAVREDLRRTLRAAKNGGVQLEMILKDISTVRYEPQRLWRWSEIAAEETLRAAAD